MSRSKYSIAVFPLPLLVLTMACGATPQARVAEPEREPLVSEEAAPMREAAPVAVRPSPDPTQIQDIVQQRHADIRQCYIAGTFKDSSLAGTVNVTFTIEIDGTVSRTDDSGSNLPDHEVVDCVLSVFADLQFPPGGQSATEVTYPVNFGSRG